jgi:CRP-like cAMP-binding protein
LPFRAALVMEGFFYFQIPMSRGVSVSATPALNEHVFVVGLPPHIVAGLTPLAVRREFSPRTVIFREGADCDDLYLIESGRVALDLLVPGRGPVRILTIGPGELLGWSALFGEGPMTATATALEPTAAYALSGSKLRSFCDKNHEAGYRIMKQVSLSLSQRLTATRLQLLDLFAEPSRASS